MGVSTTADRTRRCAGPGSQVDVGEFFANWAIRGPLPVKTLMFLPLPALRGGGYRLAPGESVTARYDFDDINSSAIVVHADPG